jgi:hypothetical protein
MVNSRNYRTFGYRIEATIYRTIGYWIHKKLHNFQCSVLDYNLARKKYKVRSKNLLKAKRQCTVYSCTACHINNTLYGVRCHYVCTGRRK